MGVDNRQRLSRDIASSRGCTHWADPKFDMTSAQRGLHKQRVLHMACVTGCAVAGRHLREGGRPVLLAILYLPCCCLHPERLQCQAICDHASIFLPQQRHIAMDSSDVTLINNSHATGHASKHATDKLS